MKTYNCPRCNEDFTKGKIIHHGHHGYGSSAHYCNKCWVEGFEFAWDNTSNITDLECHECHKEITTDEVFIDIEDDGVFCDEKCACKHFKIEDTNVVELNVSVRR